MKLLHKAAIGIMTAVTALSCVAFSSCGEKTEEKAELTGVYGSGTFSFFSAYPGYTFKQLTFSTQTIKTYSDNRYELTVTNKSLSGSLSFDPEDSGNMDTSNTNDRGQSVSVYCGTYTAEDEEGLITLSLATPDEYISVVSGNSTSGVSYYNTAAWTDAMKTSVEGLSADEYLATVAFKPVSIVVDSSTYGFDYVSLEKLDEGASVKARTDDSISGMYGSGAFSFFSAYPGYTFKQLSGATQTLVTNKDGTYELTVTNKSLSGALSFDPEDKGNTDTSNTNDRGQSVVIYTGNYVVTDEEGLLSISLEKPTGVISITSGNSTSGSSYYNTAAWTDAMSASAAKTAEEYLAGTAFTPVTIIVDSSTYGFDYVSLTVE